MARTTAPSLAIQSLEKKIELYAQDVSRVEPQTLQTMAVELTGRRYKGADAAGDTLRQLVKSAREELASGHRIIDASLAASVASSWVC